MLCYFWRKKSGSRLFIRLDNLRLLIYNAHEFFTIKHIYEGKMLKRTKIKALLSAENTLDAVLLKGWVKTKRDSKDFSFLEISHLLHHKVLSNYHDKQ